jgi:hypothetical protein
MYLRKFGLKLNEKPLVMNNPTIRQPVVFLPLAMSLVALAPRQTLFIIALQAIAALAAIMAVFFLTS